MNTTNKVHKEDFHLISMGRSFQRKMRRKGFSTKCEIVGSASTGYGAVIHYWEK